MCDCEKSRSSENPNFTTDARIGNDREKKRLRTIGDSFIWCCEMLKHISNACFLVCPLTIQRPTVSPGSWHTCLAWPRAKVVPKLSLRFNENKLKARCEQLVAYTDAQQYINSTQDNHSNCSEAKCDSKGGSLAHCSVGTHCQRWCFLLQV